MAPPPQSSLDTLQPVLLQDFTDEADLKECLKATAAVPEVAGPPRLVRGHRLVDAAVFEPIPVCSAVRDGCTHILVMCTRPPARPPAAGRGGSPWRKRGGVLPVQASGSSTLVSSFYSLMASFSFSWRKRLSRGVTHAVKKVALNPPYMKKAWDSELVLQSYEDEDTLCHALTCCPHEMNDKVGGLGGPRLSSTGKSLLGEVVSLKGKCTGN